MLEAMKIITEKTLKDSLKFGDLTMKMTQTTKVAKPLIICLTNVMKEHGEDDQRHLSSKSKGNPRQNYTIGNLMLHTRITILWIQKLPKVECPSMML